MNLFELAEILPAERFFSSGCLTRMIQSLDLVGG
jgi:hypothetical protein